MCSPAFLMCVFVMICDAPPRRHGAAATRVPCADIHRGLLWWRGWPDCTCQLDCWLLIWSFYFQNTAQGKGICLCVCVVFVQRGDTEGWERCWEWRQTTHHLIMLECATTLCIFSVALVIGVVIVQTVRTERGLDTSDDGLMRRRNI